MNLYVSIKGNDENLGTKDFPLKTFECARDKAREYEECTVCIESGRYFFRNTLEFNEKDSNTTFKADGEVILDGGIFINLSDIKDYNGIIKSVDLAPYNIEIGEYGNRGFRRAHINSPNELFVNGTPYRIASYPKKGYVTYEEGDIIEPGSYVSHEEYDQRCAVLRCREEKIKEWANEKYAYLAGYPIQSWADDCIKLAKIDAENKTFTTDQPHLYGFKANGHARWRIVNVFSELTEAGEYYIDKDNKILYFIPDGEIKTLQLSAMDKVMVAIENAENFTFEGFVFENSRNSGVYIEGGDSVTIKNCEFRNLGILAVQIGQGAEGQPHGLSTYHGRRAEGVPVPKPISRELGQWHEYLYEFAAWDNNAGKNHRIDSCKIYSMGAGGIVMGGGNRKTLTPANNTVYNCEFYDLNRLEKTYRVAVHIFGVGNKVQHCEMHDLTSIAINVHGNDHIIEFNNIYNVVTETSDSGAIYMGRDMSEVGNIFRNNYIHDLKNPHETDLGVCAIYFDDWAIFNAVYDNFFYNIEGGGFCVVHHTCGGFLSFHNNFVIDCVPGMQPDNKSNAYIRMHKEPLIMTRVHTKDENDMRGVDITSEIYRNKYPYLYDVYKNDARPEWMYYNNEIMYKKYNIFVDGKNGDFTQIKDFGKLWRDEYDWHRRTDIVMGYENDIVSPHRVDFKSIGLIK